MNDCILIYDSEGYLAFTNKSYESILGIDRDYAKAKVWGKHISEATIKPETVLQVLKTGEPKYNNRFLAEKAGAEFIVQILPLFGKHRKIVGVMLVAQIICVHELQSTIVEQRKKSKIEQKEAVKFRPKELLSEPFRKMVGNNISFVRTLVKASTAADTDVTMLILGESGVGKDVLANAIHNASSRSGKSFEVLNCAAVPDNLIESELFGYEKGAFTGANNRGKPGKMSLANQGTLVLDEIGDMSLSLQAKLLRAIQYKQFEPIGGTQSIKTDIRIIACTNKDLVTLVEKGTFREDLYYRINVFPIFILPLRERMDDLSVLCEHFLQLLAEKYQCRLPQLSVDVRMQFQKYHWPGNIRELINVLEHAVAISIGERSGFIDTIHLPTYFINAVNNRRIKEFPEAGLKIRTKTNDNGSKPLKTVLSEVEKELILSTISSTKSKTEAIEKLGISRRTFYQKIKEFDIE